MVKNQNLIKIVDTSLKFKVPQTNSLNKSMYTHPPSQVDCDVAKIQAGIKRRAKASNDSSHKILATELGGVTQTAAVNLPSMETLQQNLSATRQKRNVPPHPVNQAAIPVLPQEYQETMVTVVLQTQKESSFFHRNKPFKFFQIQSIGLQMVLSKHALSYSFKYRLSMLSKKSVRACFFLLLYSLF